MTGKDSLRSVSGVLDTPATHLEVSDARPTESRHSVYAEYSKRLVALPAHSPHTGT